MRYLRFLLIVPALLLAAAPAQAGTFGNANAGDFLANLEVGSAKVRQVDYRFRAEASGTVSSVSVFFICSTTPGYCSGNNGDISVRIEGNNASNQPNGTVLASGLVATPTGEQTVAMTSGTATLVAGTLYHIHFVNVDPSPATNWISVDDMAIDTPVGQRQPARPDLDLSTLYRDNGGAWQSPTPRSPVFALTYTDGSKHGPGVPYDNARSSSFPKSVGGSNKIALNMTPASAKTVTGACVRLRKNVASPAAGIHLFIRTTAAGSPVLRQATSAIPSSTTPQWVCVSWAALALSSGTNYRLVADSNASSSTAYTAWPLTEISWGSPWKFTEGFAEFSSDNGSTWPDDAGDDWQMYLTT